jgi:hypothetical protein
MKLFWIVMVVAVLSSEGIKVSQCSAEKHVRHPPGDLSTSG